MADKYKNYLLGKPECIEDFPFGPDCSVMKVAGKMFAIYAADNKQQMYLNLKCDPDEALALRDVFDAVIPGYHMNKKHWNTVVLDGSIPRGEVERMIDRSYGLVVKGLKKSERKSLEIRYGEEELYK